jgi:subtilisin family serine protease
MKNSKLLLQPNKLSIRLSTTLILLLGFFVIALTQETDLGFNKNQIIRIDSIFGNQKYIHKTFQSILDTGIAHPVRVIVEFNDDPLSLLYNEGLNEDELKTRTTLKKKGYEYQFNLFERDLSKIYSALQVKMNASQKTLMKPELNRRYEKVFVGQQVTMDNLMLNEVQKLPYVKKIYRDRIVKVNLNESVYQISADSVWNELGSQGDSVRVGIIDTGIDYNHPDLGGGYGPGFKVIGGYDFVHNDTDPMDDHSHGTHCAGIVAANGTLKGVAPKALLYALKVLDSQGSGWSSDIISAIEFTVDPDGDNDFSDKLDVASMSLGGEPMEDDPMVDAVENSVSLGVTFCIAAGNDGYVGAGTIGSPGISPSAITVGAVDKENIIANFSSIGPADFTLIPKPDILAPGVEIYSTVPGGQYETMSGTSMATPHITGVCALLKRLHPKWSPADIKAAIMMRAKDIDLETVAEGAGIVNAYQSALIYSLVDKPIIYFGMDSSAIHSGFISSDTFTIRNISATTQSYMLNIEAPDSGIMIVLTKNNFSLNPGENTKVGIDLIVNNSKLNSPATLKSTMHDGRINITSNGQLSHVQWAFNRAVSLNLDTVGNLFNIFIFNNDVIYDGLFRYDIPDKWYIVPGEYFVIAEFIDFTELGMYYNKILFRQVDIDSSLTLYLDENDAVKKIIFDTEDEAGNKYTGIQAKDRKVGFLINDSTLYEVSRYSENTQGTSGWQSVSEGWGDRIYISTENTLLSYEESEFRKMDTLYFSPIPEVKKILVAETRRDRNNGYHLCFNQVDTLNVLDSTIVMHNSADNYKTVTIRENRPTKEHVWYSKLWWETRDWNDWGFSMSNSPDLNVPYYTFSMVPSGDPNLPVFYYPTLQRAFDFYTSPLVYVDDKFIFGSGTYPGVFSMNAGDTIAYNQGGVMTGFHSNNNGTSPTIFGPASSIFFFPYTQGSMMENMINWNSKVYLYDASEVLLDSMNSGYAGNPEPGKYHIKILDKVSYAVNNVQVANQVGCWFDLRNEDADPPSLTSFHFRNSAGKESYVVNKNDSVQIIFSLTDENLLAPLGLPFKPVVVDSTELFAKPFYSEDWVKVPVDSIGYDYRIGSVFSGIFKQTEYDTALFDIKICTVDDAGNRTESIIRPAFLIKNLQKPIAVDDHYATKPNTYFRTDQSLTANDINPFGKANDLEISILQNVTHGRLNLFGGNIQLSYDPEENFVGVDSLVYIVRNESYTSNEATAYFDVSETPVENIQDDQKACVSIYPNPATNSINILINNNVPDNISISILDITGNYISDIFTGPIFEGEQIISCELSNTYGRPLAQGIYFVAIIGNELDITKKLIIN